MAPLFLLRVKNRVAPCFETWDIPSTRGVSGLFRIMVLGRFSEFRGGFDYTHTTLEWAPTSDLQDGHLLAMPIPGSISGSGFLAVRAHVNRLVAYVMAFSAAALMVATISPRFLVCEEPWEFFVPGLASGVLVAAVVVATGLLSTGVALVRMLVVVSMLAISLGMFALAGRLLPGMELSAFGLVVLALVGTAIAWIVYLVTDDIDDVEADVPV